MVNIGDTVHVYNEEFGADYQAVVLDVFDDGTSQVQSTSTGIKYSVETADLHRLEVCPTLHALDGAVCACNPKDGQYLSGDVWRCSFCHLPRQ